MQYNKVKKIEDSIQTLGSSTIFREEQVNHDAMISVYPEITDWYAHKPAEECIGITIRELSACDRNHIKFTYNRLSWILDSLTKLKKEVDAIIKQVE